MKKRLLALLLAFVMLFTLVACQGETAPSETPEGIAAAQALHALEDEYFTDYITSNLLSYHDNFIDAEAAGYTMETLTIGTLSEEAHDADMVLYEGWLARLEEIDSSLLNEDDLLLYEVMESAITENLRYKDFYYYYDAFDTMSGYHLNIPMALTEYKLRNAGDAEDYLVLISLLANLMDEALAFEEEKVPLGLSMKDIQIARVIEQCNEFISTAADHDLIYSYNEKVDALEDLTDEERDELKAENARLLAEVLFPAYTNVAEGLQELVGQAENTDGIYYYPNGEEYMTLQIQDYTMRGMTAQDAFDLLADAYDRVLMRATEINLADPTAYQRMQALDLSQGSTEADLEFLSELATKVFPEIQDHTLTVSEFPESFDRASMLAYYYTPPLDDYTDNVVRINPDRCDEVDFLTTLAHETYGGHLLDWVYMRENETGYLRQILNFNARTEGFAEYASRRLLLASDIDTNALEMLLLDDEIVRYMDGMLVIGIHGLGWDASDVGAFLTACYGQNMTGYQNAYYNGYLMIPPAYLAYPCGLALFQELYENVTTALGDDFNEIEYHETILNIGIAPMDIVNEHVNKWLATKGVEVKAAA